MEDQLKKLQAILALVDTKSNAEEFVQAFDEILKVFLAMKADNETERAALQSFAQSALQTIENNASSFTSRLAEDLTARITEKLASIKDGYTPRKGVDYFDGMPGNTPTHEELTALIEPLIPPPLTGSPDSAEDIRNKLELLDGEERLDAKYIKNLPEAQTSTPHVIGGHGPLWALQDVDVAGIVAGQSIQWDGTRWIPYTPVGGATTSVFGEDLTSQGPGTSYTLAHTPVSGTVRLYRGGSYQQAGLTNDYTISGATITLATTTQTGETLIADYNR